MKKLLFLFFLLTSSALFSQNEFMVWTKVGAEGKIIKRMKWEAQLNTRFGQGSVATFFPQAGVSYKVTKWLRTSLEYRFVVDKNKYGNYKSGNRLNFNANFRENIERFTIKARLRYQYAFNRFSQSAYDADFDQAIRLKPAVEYDIDNSIFTPFVSTELFFNPNYGPISPGFSKIRIALGSKLELDGPHSVGFKYLVDKRFRKYNADVRHVIALSYSYKI